MGSSAAVRIPVAVLKAASIKLDDAVAVLEEVGWIAIELVGDQQLNGSIKAA